MPRLWHQADVNPAMSAMTCDYPGTTLTTQKYISLRSKQLQLNSRFLARKSKTEESNIELLGDIFQ